MKKTLVTILLAIIMSVGVYTSTDNVIYAAESNPINIEGGKGYFWTSYGDVDYITYEYTYYMDDVLYSELDRVKASAEANTIDNSNYQYSFNLDSKTLSFRVWNLVLSSEEIVYPEETLEYNFSEETSISNVQLRLKTIFIDDDMLIKKFLTSDIIGSHYEFILNFNVEDVLGETIPIDSIYSLSVKYDLLSNTWGIFNSSKEVKKEIFATEEGDILDVWPDYYASIKMDAIDWRNNITESDYSGFDWAVSICTVDQVWKEEKTLDQTQVLTISYYYNGVFYEDSIVEHDPIDTEEIIEEGSPWESLSETFSSLETTLTLIVTLVILIVVILALIYVNNLIKMVIHIFKGAWFLLKLVFIKIPIGIWKALKFLFIPKNKRKEHKKYVGRYI